MTIPKELLDQLLTGYLDDALTADERARVEQLLQTDAEVAEELDQLQELQRSLKAVAKTDAWVKLDSGFADRVLEAAVARGRAEGIGDDHPLVRLSEQPSGGSTNKRASSWRLTTGLLIGLAASIAIAVVALRPETGQHELDSAIATTTPSESVVPEELLQSNPSLPETAIAAANPAAVDRSAVPTGNAPEAAPSIEPQPQPNATQMTDSMIAKSDLPEVRSPLRSKPNDAMTSSGGTNTSLTAILVWEVRLTDLGRVSGAVRSAMRQAAIDSAGQQKISDEIVDLATESALPASDEKISIMYLQAPAKSLDRLYLNLVTDAQNVESVRMSIAMDAPIMNVVNAVRPDPTSIQHDGSAIELSGDSGHFAQFASQLGKLSYMPASREAAVNTSKGPDVMAQVLMIVR